MRRIVVVDCGTGASRIVDVSLDDDGQVSVYQPEIRCLTSVLTSAMHEYIMNVVATHQDKTLIVVGATAWFRELSQENQVNFKETVAIEMGHPHVFIHITAEEEARLELEAMKYVIRNTPTLKDTRYIMGFGGGSTQVSRADGIENDLLTVQLGTKSLPFDKTKSRSEQLAACETFVSSRSDVMEWLDELSKREMASMIGITAAYHTIVAAGLPKDTHVSHGVLFTWLYRYLHVPTEEEVKKDLDGISFRSAFWLYKMLTYCDFHDIYFLRNMKVNGKDFIASWAIGYALEQFKQ